MQGTCPLEAKCPIWGPAVAVAMPLERVRLEAIGDVVIAKYLDNI